MTVEKETEAWFKKIDAQIHAYERYHQRGNKVVQKYRDEFAGGAISSNGFVAEVFSSYNMLYSNTELLRPILYNRTPRPEGRATDQRNTLARKAAEILETTINEMCKQYEFDDEMLSIIDDFLLPGQGISRIVYEPTFQKIKGKDGKEEQVKVFEEVYNEYIAWDDVIIGPARRWRDVPWIAYRGIYTKSEAADLLHEVGEDGKVITDGKALAATLSYKDSTRIDKSSTSDEQQKLDENIEVTEIYEVWDKEHREVLFISRHSPDKVLNKDEDPLSLEDFFPMPRPLFSNTTNNTLIPIPFYTYYQDMQAELEIISTRISRLVKELKRRGAYDSKVENMKELINGNDNTFIPVENWQNFTMNGGIQGALQMVDITDISNVLPGLYQQRDQIRFIIFEIMGIADIQRAVSDPKETATATRMKGAFGSLRVSKMQREVQRYVRDIYRIKAEIISEQFSPEVIALIANKPLEEVLEVMPLIRAQEPRMVSINIETDSTIEANEEGEKEKVIEFINGVTALAQSAPLMAQTFGLPFATQASMAAIRKFKMSRGLEDALEDRAEEIKQEEEQAKNQPQQEQPPSPEELKAQSEAQKLQLEQQKLQFEAQKFQAQMQQDQQKAQIDQQLKVADLQLRQQELQVKAVEAQAKIDLGEAKQAVDTATLLIKQQEVDLEEEKVKIEAADPSVNVVVGV